MASRPSRPQLTHFLCLPLHHAAPQLVRSLAALRHDLVTTQELIPSSAVRPVATLHLTLGVMSMPSPTQLQRAINFLETFNLPTLLPPGAPLTIDLRGLSTMGAPAQTSVLYAVPHDPTARLQRFAEAVRAAFESAGLLPPEQRGLKLHATVVNTVYSRTRGSRTRLTFNAQNTVRRYNGVAFAEGIVVEKIALCRMGEVRNADGSSRGYLVCAERML